MSRKITKKETSGTGDPSPECVNFGSTAIDTVQDTIWDLPEIQLPGQYIPTVREMEIVEKNKVDVGNALSGDTRSELAPRKEESKDQRKAFQIWYRQHLSGLFKSDQVDAAVARAMGNEIGTIRRWKTQFGWAKRLENLKKEEKAEEKLLLYAKNDAVEHDSLDVVLRYLAYIRSLASADLQPHHVSMMMKLVEFSQKNKDKMDPPAQTMSASGVSLTIQQN
jgi:hypothetical protein